VTVEFHSSARSEFLDAIDYYNKQQPDLGFEFADEVRSAIERVKSMPETWVLIDKDNLVRRCQTHRFQYGVIYQIQPTRILILAVRHLRRREDYWRDRI
jgi:plasmid stabilization system protein ParE